MSSNYCRVPRGPVPTRSYGYDKVSAPELKSIIMRVQRPTHSSEQNTQFPDGYFKFPLRPSSGLCRRVNKDEVIHQAPRQRGVSTKLMGRMIRRLQTPTESRRAAAGQIIPDYDVKPPPAPRFRSTEEEKKFLRRITRPTSNTHRRDLDTYWNDIENLKYYDTLFRFDGESPVDREELASIVERLRTPTVASDHTEGAKCFKRRPSYHINRDKLPLVSGLARSKKVDDITERLYRPTSSSKRTSTTSTDIYVAQR